MDLEVSAELRKNPAYVWTAYVEETAALLGAALAIMNPNIYDAGIQCIRTFSENPHKINKNDRLGQILQIWASPYTACSLINNRNTPLHRDNGANYQAMDLLTTVGDYKNGWLELPGLGYRLRYNSGTVVTIAGRVVRHGATADGERLCWAQYLRQSVLESLEIPEPSWVSVMDITSQ